MADTFTANLKARKIEQGGYGATWAGTFNTDVVDLLDDAIAGTEAINLGVSTTYALAALADGVDSESRALRLRFTGTPASAVTVTVPTSVTGKLCVVENACGQSLTIKYAATAGVTIANGDRQVLFADGSSVGPIAAGHLRTAAEISAVVTPTNFAYESIRLDRYGTVDRSGVAVSNSALTDAVSVSEDDFNRPVKIQGGSYRFDTSIAIGQGTKILGEGSQGSNNTYGTTLQHTGTGDFLVWGNGVGADFAGTGGGLSHVQLSKTTAASGGDAIQVIAASDDNRPGEMIFEDILIDGQGTSNWDRGFVIDGSAVSTAGSAGVRHVHINKLRVADCNTALGYVVLNQAVHVSAVGLSIDQGTGHASVGMTIEGDSDNIGMVNCIISGELEVNGSSAMNLNVHGRLSTLDVNNNSVVGTFVGGAADITNASPDMRIVSYRADMFAAYLSASTANDKTGDGTDYDIICDTEIYDQNSSYNNTTGVFTAKCAGPYLFTAIWTYANLGSGHTTSTSGFVHRTTLGATLRSYKAAGGINPYALAAGGAGGQCTRTMTIMVEMLEGEQMALVGDVSGSTRTVGFVGGNAGTMHTWWSGKLLA